jgi:hypothetical protein
LFFGKGTKEDDFILGSPSFWQLPRIIPFRRCDHKVIVVTLWVRIEGQ